VATAEYRPVRTPDQRKADLLAEIPDNQLECRAQRHPFPRVRLNKGKPKGLHILPQRDGCFEIRQVCPECTTYRWKITLPNGVLDMDAGWQMRYPKEWLVLHQDDMRVRITRRDIERELYRRAHEKLFGSHG
jgi:hypothetical protein